MTEVGPSPWFKNEVLSTIKGLGGDASAAEIVAELRRAGDPVSPQEVWCALTDLERERAVISRMPEQSVSEAEYGSYHLAVRWSVVDPTRPKGRRFGGHA